MCSLSVLAPPRRVFSKLFINYAEWLIWETISRHKRTELFVGRSRLCLAVINSDDLSSFPSRFRVPSENDKRETSGSRFFFSGLGKVKVEGKRKETKKCDVLHGQTHEISQIKKLTFKGMLMLCQ